MYTIANNKSKVVFLYQNICLLKMNEHVQTCDRMIKFLTLESNDIHKISEDQVRRWKYSYIQFGSKAQKIFRWEDSQTRTEVWTP